MATEYSDKLQSRTKGRVAASAALMSSSWIFPAKDLYTRSDLGNWWTVPAIACTV